MRNLEDQVKVTVSFLVSVLLLHVLAQGIVRHGTPCCFIFGTLQGRALVPDIFDNKPSQNQVFCSERKHLCLPPLQNLERNRQSQREEVAALKAHLKDLTRQFTVMLAFLVVVLLILLIATGFVFLGPQKPTESDSSIAFRSGTVLYTSECRMSSLFAR